MLGAHFCYAGESCRERVNPAPWPLAIRNALDFFCGTIIMRLMIRSVKEQTVTPVAIPHEHTKFIDERRYATLSWQAWLVLVLLIVGGLLRFFQLGTKSLWGDEIWTAQWSRPPLAQVLAAQTKIPDMPLMYGFVHLSTRFGESEYWVRLPAAVFGVLAILLFYRLADRTLGRQTALVGAFLMTFSPIHIWYSQDARYYAQLCALGIASVYFFYSFLTSDRVDLGSWIGYLLVTTAALYTHVFAGWIILAQGVYVVYSLLGQTSPRGKGKQRLHQKTLVRALWMVGALLLLALFTVPIASLLAETLRVGISPGGEGMASFRLQPALPEFLTITFLGEMVQYFSGGRIATLLMLPFFLVGLVTTWRTKRDVAVLLLCLITVPFFTTLFLELVHGISFKYFFFLLPAYLLLVAAGLVATARGVGRAINIKRERKNSDNPLQLPRQSSAALAVLLAFLGAILLTYAQPLAMVYAQAKNNDWRAVANYLTQEVQPEDVVLAERWGAQALRYYLPSTNPITLLAINQDRWERRHDLGARTWLIGLDDEYEHQAKRVLEKINASEWQDARLIYAPQPQHDIYYPVTEVAANIYVDAETVSSPFIDFVDIDNAAWTQETYRDLAPGRQSTVLLTLGAVAPRIVKTRYYDYPGKDFEVSIGGQSLGSVTGGSQAGWQTLQSQIPEAAGDAVRLVFTATGEDSVGLDWVKLEYAVQPTSTSNSLSSSGELTLDGQGSIDFTDIADAQWTTETYRHLAPGDEIRVSLNNPSQAERRLIVTYFDFVGKDLQVTANGQLIGTITGSDRGDGWIERSLIVPGGLGEQVLIRVQAIGHDASGVSSLAIHPTE